MKKKCSCFWFICMIFIIIFLSTFDLKTLMLKSKIIIQFGSNLIFINSIIEKIKTLLLFTIIVGIVAYLISKFSFTMTKISFLGLEFEIKDKDKQVKNKLKAYLTTKRSLFYFNPKQDNIDLVLNSYYDIYSFLREQIQLLDENSSLYSIIEEMVTELNKFLTKHHSNYRRWYDYMITERKEETYNMKLEEVQKQYYSYSVFCSDIKTLNNKMIKCSSKIGLDVNKWK